MKTSLRSLALVAAFVLLAPVAFAAMPRDALPLTAAEGRIGTDRSAMSLGFTRTPH